MKIKILKAKHTGFCFGVKRAISIAENFLKKNKHACSVGPIIHNPEVVKDLARKGLKVIDDIDRADGSCIVIRSHGISPGLRKKAEALSASMVDATCPFVKRSQSIVSLLKRQGYKIIIAGEKNHPEVKALFEIAGPSCSVITGEADYKRLRLRRGSKVACVAQTTLSREQFFRMVSSILKLGVFEYRIFDTICNDVVQRQLEAKRLAKDVDVMIVVGGRMSANTKHLAAICRDRGTKTYQIETAGELKRSWFNRAGCVGVISGASTPAGIVNTVVKKIEKI